LQSSVSGDTLEAAERAGVTLMIAENVQYSPLYHKIRELPDRGAVGKPVPVQRAPGCSLTHRGREPRISGEGHSAARWKLSPRHMCLGYAEKFGSTQRAFKDK